MEKGALIIDSPNKGHKNAMALVAGPTMLQSVKTKQVSKEIESVKETLLTADEPHSSQQGKGVQGQQFSIKAPMMMFCGEDLQDTCQKLMQKFLKKSILDSADTAYKVAHLDVLDTKNHRSTSDIDIRFATKQYSQTW